MPRTAAHVRAALANVLPLDLIGPWPGHPLESEQLEQPPSRWYLTGFLIPRHASEEQATDETSTEEIAVGESGAGGDDENPPERSTARMARFPSSMGLSVLVPENERFVDVSVSWGDYQAPELPDEAMVQGDKPTRALWKRTARSFSGRLDLETRTPLEILNSDGLKIVVKVRRVPKSKTGLDLVPPGTRAVAVFFVNDREPTADKRRKDEKFAFQTHLQLHLEAGFVPRPNVRGRDSKDWDDRLADVQYRHAAEHAVGHGVATRAILSPDGPCRTVETTWVPTAQVEKVVPGGVPKSVELGMEALANTADSGELLKKLGLLCTAYEEWITEQRNAPLTHANQREIADELLRRATMVRERMAAGIAWLAEDPTAFEAFRMANRVMAKAARRRAKDFDETKEAPRWRPFQLAFLLMNLRGLTAYDASARAERETVDLLFFPTGGGKTEAYLGLAAFALVWRRLKHPGLSSAGVTVLMRYTLRLLTLDQLGRAATLICALELERQKDPNQLGPWPFEIGLWVGQAATPNRMGKKNDGDNHSARARTIAFKNNDKTKPSPIPLEKCPWCDTKFTPNSFQLMAGGKPNEDHPTDLRITCSSRDCVFRGDRVLPIVTVDDAIYRRLPCFLIATVDKFASLPFVGRTGALFGKADRYDKEGFYGPCDEGRGRRLEKPLLPPELVIQDELHLISGPLGTMVGLYETVLDALSLRIEGEQRIRPKVIASTATVRRADRQIRALFARPEVEIFPPPGPDVRDSFFSRTVPARDPDHPAEGSRNARLYVGIAAQGRSLKVVLLRTYLALLSAAQRLYDAEGGANNAQNPADPYMTLLGYFNSLRELGGSRRIVEDEVRSRVAGYRRHTRLGETHGLFENRTIAYEVLELTSRESTAKVAEAKRRLELGFSDEHHVDVALATNMISVGLDITRLGLMVVLGQPKTAAEYIQATSRVGRDDERPGLVVTLMNVHRPRDRSHYERFEAFHATFYRAVEATSVTPFAPRAVDRGIAGVTVSLARHGRPEMTPARAALEVGKQRSKLDFVVKMVGERYAAQSSDMNAEEAKIGRAKLEGQVSKVLDAWVKLAHGQEKHGADLQYHNEEGGPPPLLYDPLDPELASLPRTHEKHVFKAQRSLRDVEPSVNLFAKGLDGIDVEEDEEVAE